MSYWSKPTCLHLITWINRWLVRYKIWIYRQTAWLDFRDLNPIFKVTGETNVCRPDVTPERWRLAWGWGTEFASKNTALIYTSLIGRVFVCVLRWKSTRARAFTETLHTQYRYIEHVHEEVQCQKNYFWQNDCLSNFAILNGLCTFNSSFHHWQFLSGVVGDGGINKHCLLSLFSLFLKILPFDSFIVLLSQCNVYT